MRLTKTLQQYYSTFRLLRQESRYRVRKMRELFGYLDRAYDAMPPAAQVMMDDIYFRLCRLQEQLNYRNWGH